MAQLTLRLLGRSAGRTCAWCRERAPLGSLVCPGCGAAGCPECVQGFKPTRCPTLGCRAGFVPQPPAARAQGAPEGPELTLEQGLVAVLSTVGAGVLAIAAVVWSAGELVPARGLGVLGGLLCLPGVWSLLGRVRELSRRATRGIGPQRRPSWAGRLLLLSGVALLLALKTELGAGWVGGDLRTVLLGTASLTALLIGGAVTVAGAPPAKSSDG